MVHLLIKSILLGLLLCSQLDFFAMAQHPLTQEVMNLSLRPDVKELGRADVEALHTVVFGVVQKNQDRLQEVLLEVSTPGNPNYGKHWTKEQLDELTRNQEGHDAVVNLLRSNPEITIEEESQNGLYIHAKAPVRVWEQLFETEFLNFEVEHTSEKNFIRCKEVRVPSSLAGHVAIILNTIQLPTPPHRGPIRSGPKRGGIHGGPVKG